MSGHWWTWHVPLLNVKAFFTISHSLLLHFSLASEANMVATVGFVCVAQWLWQSGWLLAEAAQVTDTVVVTVWLSFGWSCSGDWHSGCDSLVGCWLKLLRWLTQWFWQSGWLLAEAAQVTDTVVVTVWLAVGWSCSGNWHSGCDSLVGYWLKLLK